MTATSATAGVRPTPGMVMRRRTPLVLEGMAGEALLDLLDLQLERVHETQCAADLLHLIRWQRDWLQPAPSGLAEDVGAGRFDQVAVEDAVDPVAEGGALADPRAAVRDLAAKRPGGLVRHPYLGDEVRSQQLGQNRGVDLVGLDLGLSNGLDRQS